MAAQTVTKKCPFCAEDILAEAIKCKHCGSMLAGSPANPQNMSVAAGDSFGYVSPSVDEGSSSPSKVTVAGADPFAQYHTEIQGKKKGKITAVGYMGIGLGVLILVVAGASLPQANDGGQASFMMGLLGVGVIIGSYLWARK